MYVDCQTCMLCLYVNFKCVSNKLVTIKSYYIDLKFKATSIKIISENYKEFWGHRGDKLGIEQH